MALHLGSSGSLKIYTPSGKCKINIYSSTPIVNNILLLSADDCILKDSNGLYLTIKELE